MEKGLNFNDKWLPKMQDGGMKPLDNSKLSKKEYERLYNEGRVATYDAKDDVYQPPVLPEVNIVGDKPKSVKDFFKRYGKKVQNENNSLGETLFKLPVEYLMGLPQASMTYLLDPEKNLDPASALGIENQYGAFAVNALADPSNLLGVGVADDIFKLGLKASAKKAAKNTYKVNPLALKENPSKYLYRARPVGQDPKMNMAAVSKLKKEAGEKLPWWQEAIIKSEDPQIIAREKYFGKWFEEDPSRLDFYLDAQRGNFDEADNLEILRLKLAKEEAEKLSVKKFEDAKILSASPDTEYILPEELINKSEKFSPEEWQQLIKEDEQFNTPHWLKGFKEVSKQQKGGTISEMGYKRNSPFKNKKEIDINSNLITMDGVDIPLMLIPNNDEPIVAQPNSGEYNFKNSTEVKEIPLSKYKLGGKQCMECGGKVKYQDGGVYTLTVSDNFSGNKTTVNNAELQEQLDRTGTNAERDVNLLTKLTRKRLHQNVATNKQHADLKETIQRGVKAVILNENEVENGARKSDEGLDDSWAMYLGLPQKHKTWEISPYSPANSKNPEQVYYRFNQTSSHKKHKDFNEELLDKYFSGNYQENKAKIAIENARMRAEAYQEYVDNPRSAPGGKNASPDLLKEIGDYYKGIVKQNNQEADSLSTVFEKNKTKYAELDKQEKNKRYNTAFGKVQFKDKAHGELLHYTADRGKDEKGEYISYYDIYDFAGSNGTAGMGLIGKPFEIYDRIYFDPTTLKAINPDSKKDFIKIKPNFNKKQEGGRVSSFINKWLK